MANCVLLTTNSLRHIGYRHSLTTNTIGLFMINKKRLYIIIPLNMLKKSNYVILFLQLSGL